MQAKEEANKERAPRTQQRVWEVYVELIILLIGFEFLAWSLDLSRGENFLGIMGICFAVYVEARFDKVTEQLNELRDVVRQ